MGEMRHEVRRLVEIGPFPPEEETTDDEVEQFERALLALPEPLTDPEAAALLSVFGGDDYYGLATTLVRVIETAPNLPPDITSRTHANRWIALLHERAERAASQHPRR